MGIIHKSFTLKLLFIFFITSLQGQSPDLQNEEFVGCAYNESIQSAHWSAYIPITLMVVAAILLGIDDRNHRERGSESSSSYQYNKKKFSFPFDLRKGTKMQNEVNESRRYHHENINQNNSGHFGHL